MSAPTLGAPTPTAPTLRAWASNGEQVVVDCVDPGRLAAWWREALGWVAVNTEYEVDGVYEIRPSPERGPSLLFGATGQRKIAKNRLHLDFRPDDRDVEVDRLRSLGATRVDVGQVDVSWVVLADPEGNEFCILSGRTS